MFLVGYGIHSSAWQIRLPGAEYSLLNHYNSNSTVKTILEVLCYILNDINEQYDRSKQQVKKIATFSTLLEQIFKNYN